MSGLEKNLHLKKNNFPIVLPSGSDDMYLLLLNRYDTTIAAATKDKG